MALEFLSYAQSALISTGYNSIILKVKQVICLESLFLKKDLVAVLPTGYGKSLFFQVLPRMLSERDSRSMSLFYLELSFFAVSKFLLLCKEFVSFFRDLSLFCCEFLSIFVVFILFGSELTLFCLDLSLSFAVTRVYFAVSFVVVPCVRLVLP